MGGGFKPGGNNIIVRNITVAPGYGNRGLRRIRQAAGRG